MVQVGIPLSSVKISSYKTGFVCPPQESIRKRNFSSFTYGFITSIRKSLYNAVVSLPDFEDVMATFVYIFAYSSTDFCTLGPKFPFASCRQMKTVGSSFPDRVITYCAVYECVTLFISFRLTSTTFDPCSARVRLYVDWYWHPGQKE